MKLRKVVLFAAVLAIGASIIVGCGSSGSSSDSTGGATGATDTTTGAESTNGGSESAGVAAAQKLVAEHENGTAGLELPKLAKVPEKGVKVDIVTCPLPPCASASNGAVEAAEVLGWDYKVITPELTPESYVTRFNEIAANPPDALFFLSAFPNETVKSQLTKLEDAGVALSQNAPQKPSEKPTEGIPSVLSSQKVFSTSGEIAAAKVIAESNGSADAAVVVDPSFGTLTVAAEGWESQFEKNCPECGLGEVDISLNSPAPENLSKVISYLRQNPDTKYVYFTIGSSAAGFPGALASAGLSDVKFITQTPQTSDLEQIANGEQWAAVANEQTAVGWRGIDAVARQLGGESVGPERYPTGRIVLLTDKNVPSEFPPSGEPEPTGYQQSFYEAWGVEP